MNFKYTLYMLHISCYGFYTQICLRQLYFSENCYHFYGYVNVLSVFYIFL